MKSPITVVEGEVEARSNKVTTHNHQGRTTIITEARAIAEGQDIIEVQAIIEAHNPIEALYHNQSQGSVLCAVMIMKIPI